MTFGEKLVYLRERHGMSQEELAEKLDVSRQTISNWENDKVKIDVDKAMEICQIFDVDLNRLFLSETDGLKREIRAEGNQARGPSKKLVLPIVICCVILMAISVALLIVSSVLLSQINDSRLEPSLASTLIHQGGFVSLIICSLLTTVFTAVILIIAAKRSKK